MKTELYKVIKAPYLTEKVSALMGDSNQYAFKLILMQQNSKLRKQLKVISLSMSRM